MTGIEGGGEFAPEPVPEPIPEAMPEVMPEASPEPVALEQPAEPAPVEPIAAPPEPVGTDADLVAEATVLEHGIDTARAEDAASRKLTQELQERLSDAGVDAPNETVATGDLSTNPEHLAGELAAVRTHGEQRAAFLAEQAKASEAMEAQLDQDLADEADALDADWHAREAADTDSEAESRMGEEMRRDELAASAAAEMEERLQLGEIAEEAQSQADIAEFLTSTRPQELVEQTSPPHDVPLPHHQEIPAAPDPAVTAALLAGFAFKKQS